MKSFLLVFHTDKPDLMPRGGNELREAKGHD
jgi:hypothetical protein